MIVFYKLQKTSLDLRIRRVIRRKFKNLASLDCNFENNCKSTNDSILNLAAMPLERQERVFSRICGSIEKEGR